ncbi:hypothetical protein Tco_1261038, partial [Tanacetum coccineum]
PFDLDTEESDDDTEVIFDKELFLRERNTAHVTPPLLTYTPPPPFLATMEPLDTLLMGDEVISTTPARKNDEFIKSSVDDLVPIPRESKVTLVRIDLECSMPINSPPLTCTNVLGDAKVDINLPFREHLDTLSTRDREINFNPRDIKTNDPIPNPRMFDVPLGNNDSVSRSFDDLSSLDPLKATPLIKFVKTSETLLEELTAEIDLDDLIPTKIDDGYYVSEGDILYLEELLNEDTSSDLSEALLPKEPSPLVLPLYDAKQICLREVERFIHFSP